MGLKVYELWTNHLTNSPTYKPPQLKNLLTDELTTLQTHQLIKLINSKTYELSNFPYYNLPNL